MRQTMKKLLALLCVMAILLGLTACHTSEKPEETEPAMQQQSTQPTDPEKTDTQPTDPESTDPEPTEPKPTELKPTEPEPTEPQPTEAVSELSGWQDFSITKAVMGFITMRSIPSMQPLQMWTYSTCSMMGSRMNPKRLPRKKICFWMESLIPIGDMQI